MRGIRGEAALVFEGFVDAPDQCVECSAQRRNFLGQGGRFVEWRQGLHIERADLVRHRIHRPQVAADAPPDRQRHQRQRQRGGNQQRQANFARQTFACRMGLADDDPIFRVGILYRIEPPACAFVLALAESRPDPGFKPGVAHGRGQTQHPSVIVMPHLECDGHRIVMAVILEFLRKMLDFAGRHDRQQGVGDLRQLAVEQFVRFMVRALIHHQRGQQPDCRHRAGQQPHQPPPQGIGLVHGVAPAGTM